ncbi:hypothetical protein PENDEC_c006G06987 [Penicillium decumbens]|uniref:DUF7703 domain-containing protein n=1 Tax=Penicillium decumbens TaxID=69771 RepID=A0A1V6PFD0_PENDC|nr:hypothetical protein PENDEC_c006G06987 [Penicillium decumbens]
MDMYLISLPAEVGQFLMRNIAVVEVIAMFSIGAYNALEVGIATFDCFKHYRGLYFHGMQVASWGILVHAIPAQIRCLSQAPNLPMAIPFIVGWYAMVTGQAVVLYSRLHLVVTNMRHLYWVLWMIIGNFFVLQVPMTVLFFEVDLGNGRLARAAAIYDRIQLLGFCLQDSIISGIYIREALRALQPVFEIRGRDGRKVIINLIAINVIVVIMNILLILTEFKAHFIQISFKTVVYSIKLKLEFSVLTRLRSLTRTYPCIYQNQPGSPRRSSDINIFDMTSAQSRAMPDIEAPPIFPHDGSTCPSSITRDFREAFPETASNENIHSKLHSPTTTLFSPTSLSSPSGGFQYTTPAQSQ